MKLHRQVLRQAWAIFGPLKWRILIILVGVAAIQALSLAGPYITGMIIDNVAQGEPQSETYFLVVIAGVIFLISHWGINLPRELYELHRFDIDVDEIASDHTMKQMTDLSVGQHNQLHSGLKQSILNRGQHSLTSLVVMLLYDILPTLTRAIILTIAMCWLSWVMGVVVLAAITIYTGVTLWINHVFKGDLRKLEKMWNHESKFRNEIVQHISHVLVNAQEKKAINEADAKYYEAAKVSKSLWHRIIILAYFKTMSILVARVVVLALGVSYLYSGTYTTGTMVVFLFWSNSALDAFWQVGNLHRQIMKMWTSIVRYCEFLALENDVKIVPNPVALDPVRGKIEVRNVSFVYDSRVAISPEEDDEFMSAKEKSNKPALQDVSFIIEPGETVAIVGESGSGKTTLANMLVRSSDPTSGQILIDGQDLRVIDLKSFRQQVGIVEQHVPLFDRSIRDNILYGLNGKAKDITEEELNRIVKISQISRFSHKLERGFDTLIGERGIKLSGGERQRIGIARALIKNPAIMIFDEATSSLDAAVEAEIREAIREASQGRTTILIAHRFSTIRYANRIIVMEEGRVVGEGKHDELYQSCSPYRRLVDHQVTKSVSR